MRQRNRNIAALVGLLAMTALATAQGEFTYQGRLEDGSFPANGSYDLRFQLFNASAGGSQVGATTCADNVTIVDGLFTVELDFGVAAFDGNARWLQIGVRVDSTPGNCGGGTYTTLSPRQPLTSVPYAMYAFGGPGGAGGLWAANGSHIYKTNSGGVGIGTDAPAANLEVRSSGVPRLRVAKIHTGGFGILSPAILELQSNFVGAEQPFGSVRFLDGDATLRGAVEYGPGPGLLQPIGMRFDTEGATRMSITSEGNIGVGTTAPAYPFHVAGRIYAETSGWAIRGLKTGSGTFPGVWGETESQSSGASGVRGYVSSTTPGSNSAGVWGQNFGTTSNGNGVRGTHDGGGNGVLGVSETGTGVRGYSNSASGYGGTFGDLSTPGKGLLVVGQSHLLSPVAIGSTSVPSGIMLDVNGTARVDVLEIAGADVAEKFPTSEAGAIEPGTVMSIDPANPGQLRIAAGAYSRCVAGVVSGAGDVPVGAILGNLPGQPADSPAIALSGRVWVRCDARAGAIQPGDLLTTADTPGHAMAVADHSRAMGAVIGKAMTGLAAGETGLVLVLVSLQ